MVSKKTYKVNHLKPNNNAIHMTEGNQYNPNFNHMKSAKIRSTGNSVQGRMKNDKTNRNMNIEDINIDIDGFNQHQQMIKEHPQLINYISTKKSMSTKNQ